MIFKTATNPFASLSAAVIVCLGLPACGGGGGDAPAASGAAGDALGSQPAALPTPVTTAFPAALTTPGNMPAAPLTSASDFSCGLNGALGIQAKILQRLNALRSQGAVCGSNVFAATGPLAWDNQLQ